MDWVKWTWVLFVAASVAVLVRFVILLLPAPAIQHASDVTAAVRGIEESVDIPEASLVPEVPQALPRSKVPVATPDRTWSDDFSSMSDLWESLYPEVWPLPEAATTREPELPEEFHFRRTRWGMTGTEVRAAEQIAPLRESAHSLAYITTTLDLPCVLTYFFAQNRLVRAHLAFSDPSGRNIPPLSVAQAQRRFLFLREQLRQRYGEPVTHTSKVPRDVTALQRRLQKQDELTRQYDAEIAEAETRLRQQRSWLEARYARWQRKNELVARGLAPYERDLRELKTWKQEALETAAQARRQIQEHQQADAQAPLVALMSARWPFAREVQDIELRLDLRAQAPRLDIRYRAARPALDALGMDEL
ncbi:MAG: hypothetical protein RBS84_06125 [Kiritimatiellia bacterium]|jgi:hypothetical protein|nr:hypothetical protein [Kiritimatiellia bacterium]